MVFNGEVYNFQKLRDELERLGATFRGHSDSEVMLAAFEAWGVEAAVSRFDGMYAVALWDASERRLHLFRDRFGEKPLFVYAEDGYVSFGSELKSLRAGPRFDPAVDRDAVVSYLRYLCVPAPRTIYAKARKLRPGSILTLSEPSATLPQPRPYWSLTEIAVSGQRSPVEGDDASVIAEAERIIGDSAAQRMIADVPLGAFLSGGIDSSTVVALMQQRSPKPIRTFSIGFDESDFDESGHAAAVAKHLGTDHNQFRLRAKDALDLLPNLPTWFDEPHADPSQLPTYLICREARREVTVAVSGDGGDELFAGYNRYVQGERVIGAATRMGAIGRALVSGATSAFTPNQWNRLASGMGRLAPTAARYRDPGEKLQKIGAVMRYATSEGQYRSLLSSAFQEPQAMVPGGARLPDAVDTAFSDGLQLGLVERMMSADQLEYLPDDLLAKVDRTSMAVSLEVRVPLLGREVAEFAWRLPRRFKLRDGETKWILRQVLYRHVPRAVIERPKMGFSVPIDRWMRGELRPWVQQQLSAPALQRSGLLDPSSVAAALRAFERGDGSVSGLGIWALANLQAWAEKWL